MQVTEINEEMLRLIRKKYGHISEIYRLTGEINDAFQRNDRVSAEMQLVMRGREMEMADEYKREQELLIARAPEDEQERLTKLMNGKLEAEEKTPEEQKMTELGKQMKQMLERCLDMDRKISGKIAGRDSFYQK